MKLKMMLSMAMTVVAVGAARAEASASIRWQVDNAKIGTEDVLFSYAMFKVAGVEDAYLFVNPSSAAQGVVVNPGDLDSLGSTGAAPDYLATSSYADHTSLFSDGTTDYANVLNSFYVELYDNDDRLLAVSDTWTYGELYDTYGCVHAGGNDFGSEANILHVTSFSAVPEPTSGVLFMLGLVLLGLKRKRV